MSDTTATILVADDDASALDLVSHKLRTAGYQVRTARNGREALRIAQDEQPDLLIADYQMPGLSGVEVCQRLANNTETSEMPAILLTAEGYEVAPWRSGWAGIRRTMEKPVAAKDLLATVSEVLGRRAA